MVQLPTPNQTQIRMINRTVTPAIISKRSSWKFDFDKLDFVIDGGVPTLVKGKENVLQWIEKAIVTPRFIHKIYTHAYGNELHLYIGSNLLALAPDDFAEQMLRELIMIHPQVVSIDNFDITYKNGTLDISFEVFTVDDRSAKFSKELIIS